jgi:hypothetical protein
VPLNLLNGLLTYRVSSDSMAPTLRVGDCLEIGPATVLIPGDLLVYAVQSQFVCHRLRSIERDGTLMVSGDAAPDCLEAIAPKQVRGLVTAVERRPMPIRWLIHRTIINKTRRLILGRIGTVLLPLLRRTVTIVILIPSPLRSCALSQTIHRSRLSTVDRLPTILRHLQIPLHRAQIQATLGGFTLAIFTGATGEIDMGAVALRLGLDEYFETLRKHLDVVPPRSMPPASHAN